MTPMLLLALSSTPPADWPQWLGPQRDAVWNTTGLATTFPANGPPVVWRQPSGEGYAGPAVVGDRLYVTDRLPGQPGPDAPKGTLPGKERVRCLSAADGKTVWEHVYDCPYVRVSYPSGPRTTPVVAAGRLYTLGTMGDLLCLDVATGTVVWAKNFVRDFKAPVPAWGWSAHLLLHGDSLIALVGGDKQAVVAFDPETGEPKWKALSTKEVCYAPPVLVEAGGVPQLVVWLSEAVHGLNPATGAVYWSEKHPAQGEPMRPAVSIVTPKRAGDKLLVSSFYHGTLALELAKDRPAVTVAWRSKNGYPKPIDGLNAVMTSLLVRDGHVYGIAGMGEVICQKLDTGEVVRTGTEIFGEKPAFCGAVFWVDAGERVYGLTDQGDLVILKLAPDKVEVLATAHVLEPTHAAKGRNAVWSHPAFAGTRVYLRNDKEIVCVGLKA
jgi:outer membrane protein assembly factor BamB